LFDEQFKPVLQGSNSSFDPVGAEGQLKSHGGAAGLSTGEISKNGYLYVYCSNESKIDVFFDNLQVVHNKGALLEETHYYPFGLIQQGISSKAAGTLENKKKYNGIDWENDLDLGVYDTQFRELDPAIGRWWQIDPKIDNMETWSPYASNYDNPITFSDPLGDEPEGGDGCCKVLLQKINAAAKVVVGLGSAAAVGTLDNLAGTNLRATVAQNITDPTLGQAWNVGLNVTDAVDMVAGAAGTFVGPKLMEGSVAVTAGSGGLSVAVSGPTLAAGAATTVLSPIVFANASKNLLNQNGRVSTGSYTNTHESGTKYHGKGSEERAKQSGKEKSEKNNDPLIHTDHTPAKNDREAFKQESRRLENDGGHKGPNNYNKRDSPGTKYRKQDGEK
jgi:RHS repeat-associated protein